MQATIPAALAEQRLTGAVLRALREARKLTQPAIAAQIGMTTQGYQKYEAGERRFLGSKLDAILEAIGADRETFDLERARQLGAPLPPDSAGMEARGRGFVIDLVGRQSVGAHGLALTTDAEAPRQLDLAQLIGPNSGVLQLAGDNVHPYASSGAYVFFDRDQPPRREEGCVIEKDDGSLLVKIYAGSDGSSLFLKDLYPEEKTQPLPLRGVKGVYAVTLRSR